MGSKLTKPEVKNPNQGDKLKETSKREAQESHLNSKDTTQKKTVQKEDTKINNEPKKDGQLKEDTKTAADTSKTQSSEHIDITTETSKGKKKIQTTGGSLNKDIRQFYKFKDVLGGGHFGTVRVSYRRSDPEPKKNLAIKSISKKNLTPKDFEDLMREVEILSSLDHPNIIKFYETYHDEYYFHIVMELCTGKEVFDRIIEEGHINEQKVAGIIYKVIHAISYCHSAGITHRDLKPENILFETSDPDAEIKLIDFGLSRKYDIKEKMHTVLGTPYYVAPEVLKGCYDERCDVWSIGCLAYIMLSGEPPFNGNSNNDIFHKIMNEELSFNRDKWKNVSKEAKDFIRKCMTKTPETRFSAPKAIEHPWFSKILEEVHSSNNLNGEILENLRNFASPQKFKRMVLKFLVNQLSPLEMKQLRQAFYAIDLDHTGHINHAEIGKAFQIAGVNISDEEIKKIVDCAEESGHLDYSEFLVASLNQKKFIDKEKLVSAFKYFDVDDCGFIHANDLKEAMLRSGKQIINTDDIDSMMEEVTQSQKKLSLQEFLKLFGYEI